MFTKEWFFDLEKRLVDAGLDSDDRSFAEIKSILQNPQKLSPGDFASAAIYVVLAGGFSQKTAKIIHFKIMCKLQSAKCNFDDLFSLFRNKNKINAIIKIWENRKQYRDKYYDIKSNQQSAIINQKLAFLASLPHIGKITANHLARNLGENVVKYDIWIQRLGCAFAGIGSDKINNSKLDMEIKKYCDAMFADLSKKTNLPIGYIDVVLWKGCQVGIIELKGV